VASAAPELKPNRLIATATANSKKVAGANQRGRSGNHMGLADQRLAM
jgi:hypothetical protein